MNDYEKRMEKYYSCRLCDSDVTLLRDWKVKNISDSTYYYLAKQVIFMKVDHIFDHIRPCNVQIFFE